MSLIAKCDFFAIWPPSHNCCTKILPSCPEGFLFTQTSLCAQPPSKCGADVHCRNSIDETPLHIAAKAENYSESVVKLLLDRGAHLDVPDERRIRDGLDSLMLAEKSTLWGDHQVMIFY